MAKLTSKILKHFPEAVRHRLIRRRARVPDFALDQNFTVEIARGKEDLESAYRLLHESYVGSKLMTPHASGLRCNLYTFLPHTTVIIAKYRGETVGTVSLIRDSVWGLPTDKDYRAENDQIRKGGHKLVEVSALAVSKNYRNAGNAVSLLLMKYLYVYTSRFLNSDRLVCTVHPRAEDFYKALWLFERNGKIVRYQFVQGAEAVHLSMEVSRKNLEQMIAAHGSQDWKKNLPLFVDREDDRFVYPDRHLGAQIDPVLTPELFRYFCVDRSQAWFTFSDADRASLHALYRGLFGECDVAFVGAEAGGHLVRPYRVPVDITAIVQSHQRRIFVKITDLSVGGAFIAWPEDQPVPEAEFMVSFKMGKTTVHTPARAVWKNCGESHLQPLGFGVQFAEAKTVAPDVLKNWIYADVG